MTRTLIPCRFVALALLVVVTGCGTSSYQAALDKRIKELRDEAAKTPTVQFRDYYGYAPQWDRLGPLGVNVLISKNFTKAWNQLSLDPTNDALSIHPERLFPALVRLPGYERTYEATVVPPNDPDKAEWIYSLYFGTANSDIGELDKICRKIGDDFKMRIPNAPDTWQNVLVPIPGGGDALQAKKLRIEGDFYFDRKVGGEMRRDGYAGVILVYVIDAENVLTIAAAKAPKHLEDYINLESTMLFTLGSLTINDQRPTQPQAGGGAKAPPGAATPAAAGASPAAASNPSGVPPAEK